MFVKAGDTVAKGDRIAVIEAMKMEHVLHALRDGVVAKVAVPRASRSPRVRWLRRWSRGQPVIPERAPALGLVPRVSAYPGPSADRSAAISPSLYATA